MVQKNGIPKMEKTCRLEKSHGDIWKLDTLKKVFLKICNAEYFRTFIYKLKEGCLLPFTKKKRSW